MSKQNPSQLDSLIEEYLSVSNKSKKENLLIQIMSSLWRQGFQKFDDKFRSSFTKKQKVEFIENIFNILKKSETIDKGAILEILKDILIKSDVNIKDEIISVYYDELFNEKDFMNALQSLRIFIGIWDRVDDSFKLKIFEKLLDFVDNIQEDILIEEGFFEITNLLENYSAEIIDSSQRARLLDVFVKKIEDRKETSIKYAGFESLKKLVDVNVDMIDDETFNKVRPLLEKFVNYKQPSVILSLIRLFLWFDKFLSAEDEQRLREMIKNIKKRLDFSDIHQFFEIFRMILLYSQNIDKNALLRENFDIFQMYHKRRATLEEYTLELYEEIINLMWPILTDEEKDLFYRE